MTDLHAANQLLERKKEKKKKKTEQKHWKAGLKTDPPNNIGPCIT